MTADVDGEVYQEISNKIAEYLFDGYEVNNITLSDEYYEKLQYETGTKHGLDRSASSMKVMGINVYSVKIRLSSQVKDIVINAEKLTCSCGQEKFYNKKEDTYYCPACE